ncbi:MAG: hypothetical protein ACHQHO_11315 [Solirubrobacterales bacterium]
MLGSAVAGTSGGDEPQAGGSPEAETDPLVSNGLGSPLCAGAPGGQSLSPSSRRNCETSGFVGAAAPTGNFGIDVHIDTGLLGLSSAQLLAIVQNLFVTPLWMALVWAVHALVVMLEWCFTIDLLEGDSLRRGVARGLHEMQATITMPWLALALAIASVICAYEGLIRRRVGESVGGALLALAMMAGGLWMTVDPTGTVGALGAWANRASVGTLAVTARGSPDDPGGALALSMGLIFATAIEVPWCYLEFGDVDWCRNPSRFDPRLHAAALALAGSELDGVGCKGASGSAGCPGGGGSDARALEQSARLLRAARTNGAIFLALPPNGPARNAINDPSSLLRAICRSETATDCHGPAAAPAEFRTNHGTWSRVGGLLLIAAGVLGMLMLLCFLALRLLGAAIFSLVYLLLAPAATLAPALGETGRAVFRRWATQLLGAVVSKLLFAFLLGVVLAILAILEHLEALGWWTRWLLMSAFWWGLFTRRHQILQLAGGGHDSQRSAGRRPVLRRVGETLDARSRMYERLRAVKGRARNKTAPELAGEIARTPRRPPSRATGTKKALVSDVAASSGGVARDASRSAPESADRRDDERRRQGPPGEESFGERPDLARLRRIADQRAEALAAGNLRRAARLAMREQRIEQQGGGAGADAQERATGAPRSSAAEMRHERFLDAQSRLVGGGGVGRGVAGLREPSYVALAGIAGYGRREYERLHTAQKRAARERIDRELALRRERSPVAQIARSSTLAGTARDERDPRGQAGATPGDASTPRRPERRPGGSARSESNVMRDAREVAARRKRQLGPDLP